MGFNLGPEKILVVLVFALIFLGPDKLPEAARKLGEWLGHAKRMSGGFESELRQAIDQPLRTFQRELAIGERRATHSHARAANGASTETSVVDTAEPAASVDTASVDTAEPAPVDTASVETAVDDTSPAATPDAVHTAADPQRVTHHAPSAPQSALPSWVFPGGTSSADRPGFH